jgi:uncharacterized protein YybS (DUF2232 family)
LFRQRIIHKVILIGGKALADTGQKVPEDSRKTEPARLLNEPFSTAAITEGAMMVAISVILGVASTVIPFFGSLLFPLPIIILIMRRGIRIGIIAFIATFLLMTIFVSLPFALVTIIAYGFIGVFFGYCFRMRKKPLFILWGGILVAAIGIITAFLILPLFFAGLPTADFANQISGVVEQTIETANKQGGLANILSGETTVEEFAAQMKKVVTIIIPAGLVMSGIAISFLLYIISGAIFRRLRFDIPRLPNFSEWRLAWPFLLGLMAGIVAVILGPNYDIGWLTSIGIGLMVVFGIIIGINGSALLYWLLKHWDVSGFIKLIFIVVLIWLSQIAFLFLIVFVGFIEPLYDFRTKIGGMLKKSLER